MVKLADELEKLDFALDVLICKAHNNKVPYTQILKLFFDKIVTLITQVITETHMKS